MAPNSVNTAQQQTKPELDELTKKIRQCAALTGLMRSQLGGATISDAESEILDLTRDLTHLIYEELSRMRIPTTNDAWEVSGRLAATMDAIVDANQRVSAAADDERRVLVTRIGWLQNLADDLAEELGVWVKQIPDEATVYSQRR